VRLASFSALWIASMSSGATSCRQRSAQQQPACHCILRVLAEAHSTHYSDSGWRDDAKSPGMHGFGTVAWRETGTEVKVPMALNGGLTAQRLVPLPARTSGHCAASWVSVVSPELSGFSERCSAPTAECGRPGRGLPGKRRGSARRTRQASSHQRMDSRSEDQGASRGRSE
jgi:hypothetical protein